MTSSEDQRLSRRMFSGSLVVAGSALWGGIAHGQAGGAPQAKPAPSPAAPSPTAEAPATVSLPPLPYPEKALEPAISATTVATHYGKHHKGYVDKTNTLVQGTPFVGKPLEDIVRGSGKSAKHQKLFNAAAQVYNHNIYWQSMKPGGGGAPPAALAARIDKDFGSYVAFRELLTQTAVDHFSNGWVWLVLEKGKLRIVDTHDAQTPLTTPGRKPLLNVDVWEHAYYLDYKNLRKDYVTKYLDTLLNWDLVAGGLG
jgi:superoxide dismutase, Fe-Mn family